MSEIVAVLKLMAGTEHLANSGAGGALVLLLAFSTTRKGAFGEG